MKKRWPSVRTRSLLVMATCAPPFQFSVLRALSPGESTAEVDAAEAHYKRSLLTRHFGLNRN
ncbi:hypothetical protein BJ956_000567 [Arthrobacter psychrochitiniphilus]|nr:hypothetical protein [Arthrobacter psychrochitiniphilus]